jgi:hypothetical protein
LVTYVFDSLQQLLQPQGCFLMFAGFCAAAAVFAATVSNER